MLPVDHLQIQQSGGYLLGSADSYGTIYVPFGDTWVAGKRHIYTLISVVVILIRERLC